MPAAVIAILALSGLQLLVIVLMVAFVLAVFSADPSSATVRGMRQGIIDVLGPRDGGEPAYVASYVLTKISLPGIFSILQAAFVFSRKRTALLATIGLSIAMILGQRSLPVLSVAILVLALRKSTTDFMRQAS
jgi:hypothetical protein